LPFVQRFVPIRLNRGEVNENVLAGLALNEPEALARVKPLYRSLFLCQLISLFYLKLFVLLERPQPYVKKGRK